MPTLNAKSNYLENVFINAVLRNLPYISTPVFVALYTTDPGEADSGAEVSTVGTGYLRQAASFDAPMNGLTQNSVDIIFPVATLPWGTITHYGLRDAVTAGNMLYHGALDSPQAIGVGSQGRFLAGVLQVTER